MNQAKMISQIKSKKKNKKKYTETGEIRPQETDALNCEKSRAAKVFKGVRDKAAYDPEYQSMRKEWRKKE